MSGSNQKGYLKYLIYSTALSVLSSVCALRSASGAEATDEPVLEEVTVTAQQREQSLQQVPLSVTALTGETLLENHLRDFSDLSKLTPSFTSGANYGYIRNSSMRGISNNQYGFADDPSIAMFVDDIYQGRGSTGMQVNALYDVDRVEIIKGPQATLFGRSSIAGAISTILNQPTDSFSASGDIGVGERKRGLARGAVNFPVTPNLAIRVAVDSENEGGFIKNLNGGRELEPLDVKAGRVIVRYTGIDRLEATLKASYETRRQDGSTHIEVGLPDFTADETLIGDQNYAKFYILEEVARLKYNFLDNLSVTSQTSWRRVKNAYVEKYDGLPQLVGGPYYQDSLDRLFQQDLRLNYSGPGDLSIVGGASFFHENLDALVGNWVDHTFAFTGVPAAGLAPNDYSQAFFEQGRFKGAFRGGSAYIDGTVGVPGVPGWTVTAGSRYNYDRKNYTQDIPDPAGLAVNAGKPFAGAYYNWGYYTDPPISLTRSWSNTSFRGATNYDINQNNTVYFQYSQGWKAGGIDTFKVVVPPGSNFNLFFGQNATAAGGLPNGYDPEHSDSFEIGLKGKALERRFGYNIALYDYIYRDLQIAVLQTAGSIIKNIGRATGRGAEAELRFVPSSHWDFYLNAAYNYTLIRRFEGFESQVGLPLNQAPRYNGAAGATYKWTGSGGTYSIGASANARGAYRTDNALADDVRSYILYNTKAEYESADGHYGLTLFADNVANRFTYSRFSPVLPFVYAVASYQVIGQPRMVGLDAHVRF